MGAYYRDWLSSEHLLNPKGCESAGKITIYADKDQRTIETGRALAEALVPGCGLSTGFGHGTKEDPLFSETFTSDLEVALKAVSIRFDSKLRAQHQAAFEAVQYILGVVLTAKSIALKGSFASGSTLGENFQLEYTNGMKGKDLGWGRLTRENLFRIMEIHAVYTDLMDRTPALAQGAANLLNAVRHSMEQAASGRPVIGAIGKPGDALLVISGHDTNLSNISGLLGLSWKLPDYQQNDTPPGGALIFSLWQNAVGQHTVRLRYVAQTPDQMRNLEASPPASQDLAVPGCDPCTWTRFQQILGSHLPTP
jgi:4-phytase/acid phosphatase